MDGDDDDEEHGALVAERRLHQGDADQYAVGIGGGAAGDDAGTAVASEEAHDHDVRGDPHDSEWDEVGRPDPPRRNAVEIGGGERFEEEQRDRQREDEFCQPVADRNRKKTDAGACIAEADQPEDRR